MALELFRHRNLFKFIIVFFLFGLFSNCKKDDFPATDINKELSNVQLKENFQKTITAKMLILYDNDSLKLFGDPDWQKTFARKVGDTIYSYIPLILKLQTPRGQRNVSATNRRDYIIVKNNTHFFKATFLKTNENIQISSSTFFSDFTGTVFYTDIKTAKIFRTNYRNGFVEPKSSTNDQFQTRGYQQQCRTVYFCTWAAVCETAVYIAGTENCEYPNWAPDAACGEESWQLTNSEARQVCETVWVEDPPLPGDDGTGGGTDNPQDPNQNDMLDPCKQKEYVTRMASDPLFKNQNSQILSNTLTTQTEFGANQRITNWNGTGVAMNTPVTTNSQTASWQPQFTWDATSGYTIGFSHGHPGGTGPSPTDVWAIIYPIFNEMNGAPQAEKNFYKAHTFVNTETANGSYVVTIRDWASLQSVYDGSWGTPEARANTLQTYVQYAGDYLAVNPFASVGDAGTYALMNIFPELINVYFKAANSTQYRPLNIDRTTEYDYLNWLNCP